MTAEEWVAYLNGEGVERGPKDENEWSDGWSVFAKSNAYAGHLYVEQMRGTSGFPKHSGSLHHMPESLHTLAALALHGQPFGFTREDVTLLADRVSSDVDDGEGREYVCVWLTREESQRLDSLIARISALLPPEAPTNG